MQFLDNISGKAAAAALSLSLTVAMFAFAIVPATNPVLTSVLVA
ncbi:hypothetical protein [Tsuneonella mangrovi]|nr:hypothetical protein [Tsuneonella mangrovi]